MVEIPTPEKDEQEEYFEEPFDIIVESCRSVDLPLTVEELGALIPAVTYQELGNHEIGKTYDITPLGIVDIEGIKLDPSVKDLDPEERKYILMHEVGHVMELFLEDANPSAHNSLIELISSVEGKQISSYVSHIEENADEQHKEGIYHEKVAEIVAQYFTGGGTLGGMIRSRLGRCDESETSINAEKDPMIEAFLAGDDTLTEELAKRYPHVQQYLQIFSLLDGVLRDPNTYTSITELIIYEGWDPEYDMVDYPEMSQQIVAEDSKLQATRKPQKAPGLFEFASIFQ